MNSIMKSWLLSGTIIMVMSISLPSQSPRFQELDAAITQVVFENGLVGSDSQNIFIDFNYYSGGGVAIGDFDNDGLPDLYFSGNQVGNAMYRNLGGMRFEDVTERSGTKGLGGWNTGVTVADVNGDGLLDLYVCRSGQFKSRKTLPNLLFINEGDFRFREQAVEYGLADPGRSVQATFFDLDQDNDLDVYIANRPENFYTPQDKRLKAERFPNSVETDRLYRNDDGKFTDITDQAGVRNWAFGLNVLANDFDGDGLIDLFVSNDFAEPDFYWKNNGNGTFKMWQNASFLHISNFSMGADAGDINNDGHRDLVVVDMVAKDNRRKKTNMSGMEPETFWRMVDAGHNYQYMQNVLQVNNGNGTFGDIAELAGVAYTDWSWSPILADFDNDGYEDLFVSNGMRKDVRNNDSARDSVQMVLKDLFANWEKFTNELPEEPIANFCFRNQGDLSFQDKSESWGLAKKGYSTGAAVADLDLDGDLDLVLNNVDERASIFENKLSSNRSLRIRPKGPPRNLFGLNLKAELTTTKGKQTRELTLTRGFRSSSEPILHFGLQEGEQIRTLKLTWPDGKVQLISEVKEGKVLTVDYQNAEAKVAEEKNSSTLFTSFTRGSGLDFVHEDSWYDDFINEILLPHQYSQNGPMLAVGDLNGDGQADLFVGGAKGQAAGLFLQQANGRFVRSPQASLEDDATHEDMGAIFSDVDLDGDQDLIVTSGSNEMPAGDPWYRHRLYRNDGQGNLVKDPSFLQDYHFSASRIHAADFDNDGDEDLFIGGRIIPGAYPQPASSVILRNEGGKFKDVTQEVAPELKALGLVTDAVWADMDQDEDLDLLVCGEWMSIEWFRNDGSTFSRKTQGSGLGEKVGWWYSLVAADMDGDGDQDLVAGNLGLNAKYQASDSDPFEVYSNDMDKNGSLDIVLGYSSEGKTYPVRGRECSSQQVPQIKKDFPSYEAFGNATILDVYGDALERSLHYSANWMASSYIENLGQGRFQYHALPNQAQLSSANSLLIEDFTGNGHSDILLAGNLFASEVETQRHDASIGVLLEGDGKGGFRPMSFEESGFFAQGDVKDMAMIKGNNGKKIVVIARSNMALKVVKER